MKISGLRIFLRNSSFLAFIIPFLKCFYDKRYFYYYFQQRIVVISYRRTLSAIEAKLFGKKLEQRAKKNKYVEQLENNGFTDNLELISEERTRYIFDYLSAKSVSDPSRPQHGRFSPYSPPKDSHVGYLDGVDVASAPHVMALANHPVILDTVSQVFGCKPKLDYVGAWWSFSGCTDAEEQQYFHRDIDSLQFIKFFLYLTNVDDSSGPHVYVRGSHKKQWQVKSGLRIEDAAVAATFPAEDIIKFKGQIGTCFLENTFGIHKGKLPETGSRLLLQFIYSVIRTPFFRPRRAFLSMKDIHSDNAQSLDKHVNEYFIRSL